MWGIGVAGRTASYLSKHDGASENQPELDVLKPQFVAGAPVLLRILGLKDGYGTHREKCPTGVPDGSAQSEPQHRAGFLGDRAWQLCARSDSFFQTPQN